MRLTVLGRLTAATDRSITGLLLPYGEVGHTNLGPVTAAPGTLTMPADLSRLAAALEHPARGGQPAARFVRVWDEADGLHAAWEALPGPAGDQLLAEFAAGTRTGISVELEPVAIRGGAIVGGHLDACAFPAQPAFDSARLAASYAGVPDVALDEARTPEQLLAAVRLTAASGTASAEDVTAAAQALTYTLATNPDATPDDLAAAALAAAGLTVEPTTDPTTDTTDTTDTSGDSAVPQPLTAGRQATVPLPLPTQATGRGAAGGTLLSRLTAAAAGHTDQLTALDVYTAMAGASGGDRRMVAALADITATGTELLSPPAWLGEIWSGVAYQRRIVPLLGSAPLTSLRVAGYRWDTKPVMGDWAGDKAEVPTGPAKWTSYEDKAKRLAGAHDIDRAMLDFPDPEFWQAYFAAMAESYSRLTDARALTALVAASHDVTLGAVPTDIDPGTSAVVDLALDIIDVGVPTFAIVAKDVYRAMLLTPATKRLAFLTQSLSLADGTLETFPVVPWADLAPGTVEVGTRQAATFRELGSTPIRADALDIAKGGTDQGCYGYYHVQISEAAGLAHAVIDA